MWLGLVALELSASSLWSPTVIKIHDEALGCVRSDIERYRNPKTGKQYGMKWSRLTMPWAGDANLYAQWVRLMESGFGAEIWLGWCAMQWVALSSAPIGEIQSLDSVYLLSRVPMRALHLALAWAVVEGLAESDECCSEEELQKFRRSSSSEIPHKFLSSEEVPSPTLGKGTGRHVPLNEAKTREVVSAESGPGLARLPSSAEADSVAANPTPLMVGRRSAIVGAATSRPDVEASNRLKPDLSARSSKRDSAENTQHESDETFDDLDGSVDDATDAFTVSTPKQSKADAAERVHLDAVFASPGKSLESDLPFGIEVEDAGDALVELVPTSIPKAAPMRKLAMASPRSPRPPSAAPRPAPAPPRSGAPKPAPRPV